MRPQNRLCRGSLFSAVFSSLLIGTSVQTFADQVILDDLIIDGSMCTGFDCVNGESFGFDTIRLKENNLRINFEDTSTSASFPSNDWRLRINDSSNGGGNYFAVENATLNRTPFLVDADARSNALIVKGNRVGFGTSNPVTELHSADGDTPTLRLDQNGNSGWTPQSWDVAGNETNFFIRDVTNGSALPFKILPGASTDSLVVSAPGDIGMGTRSPDARLEVVGGDGTIKVTDVNSNNVDKNGFLVSSHFDTGEEDFVGLRMQGIENSNILYFGGGSSVYNAASAVLFYTGSDTSTLTGVERMRINSIGQVGISRVSVDGGNILQVGTDATNGAGARLTNAGVWTNASTRANKIDIVKLTTDQARDAVMQLQPVTYRGKQNSEEQYVGFIAEEVPELVAMNDRNGIAAIEVAAVLAKVVKSHETTIANLSKRLEELEAKLAK